MHAQSFVVVSPLFPDRFIESLKEKDRRPWRRQSLKISRRWTMIFSSFIEEQQYPNREEEGRGWLNDEENVWGGDEREVFC